MHDVLCQGTRHQAHMGPIFLQYHFRSCQYVFYSGCFLHVSLLGTKTHVVYLVFFFPMPVIWRLRMPSKQKLAVSGICGLAVITVAFDTLRTVKLYTEDFTLTNLYSYLELIIAVLTGMLPSYRFLVSPAEKDREYRRLFWTRVTLRRSVDSSGVSMEIIGHQRADQSQGAVDDGDVGQANSPITTSQPVTMDTQA